VYQHLRNFAVRKAAVTNWPSPPSCTAAQAAGPARILPSNGRGPSKRCTNKRHADRLLCKVSEWGCLSIAAEWCKTAQLEAVQMRLHNTHGNFS
jgi:hypothetical protein